MGTLIKGWKVMLLTKDGHESGKAPEEVGWQSTNEPDIRDGVLIIKMAWTPTAYPSASFTASASKL